MEFWCLNVFQMGLLRIRCEVYGRAGNWTKYPESQAVWNQRALQCGNINSTRAWRGIEQGFSFVLVSYMLSFPAFSVGPKVSSHYKEGSGIRYSWAFVLVWLKDTRHVVWQQRRSAHGVKSGWLSKDSAGRLVCQCGSCFTFALATQATLQPKKWCPDVERLSVLLLLFWLYSLSFPHALN